jgi:hypothetical protein
MIHDGKFCQHLICCRWPGTSLFVYMPCHMHCVNCTCTVRAVLLQMLSG